MNVVDRAIAAEGLDRWLARRLARDVSAEDEGALSARIETLDLLVLGALADRVRAHEVGDVVRLHLQRPSTSDEVALFAEFDPVAGGAAFVRRVARARLLGSPAIPVRIDVDAVGVEIAQVALAFGANELVAPVRRSILTKPATPADDGLPWGHDAVLRERELAALVRSAGRTPRIVEWLAGAPRERPVDGSTEVKRRFRAPGREARDLADAQRAASQPTEETP